MNTVRTVIDLWPDVASIASDCAVTDEAIYQWMKRGKIPPKQWPALARGAEKRGIAGVTLDTLAALQDKDCQAPHQ